MKGYTHPRRLTWGAWRAPVEARIRRVSRTVKRVGEQPELSTTKRGSITQMEHGNKLGAGIDGEPEPEGLLGIAQPGAQFVQLQVREVQMAEEALVQALCMHGLHGTASL